MIEWWNMLGLGGLAAAIPVISLFLMIRRDMRATNAAREDEKVTNAVWRTHIERDIKALREKVETICKKLS